MVGGKGGKMLSVCRENLSFWELFEVFCVLAVCVFFSLLSSMNFCGMLTGDRNVGFPAALPKSAMTFG